MGGCKADVHKRALWYRYSRIPSATHACKQIPCNMSKRQCSGAPILLQLAEDALMSRLQPGQRALRRNIVRDLQQQGYDKLVVQR